jgi:hypothetical protein
MSRLHQHAPPPWLFKHNCWTKKPCRLSRFDLPPMSKGARPSHDYCDIDSRRVIICLISSHVYTFMLKIARYESSGSGCLNLMKPQALKESPNTNKYISATTRSLNSRFICSVSRNSQLSKTVYIPLPLFLNLLHFIKNLS